MAERPQVNEKLEKLLESSLCGPGESQTKPNTLDPVAFVQKVITNAIYWDSVYYSKRTGNQVVSCGIGEEGLMRRSAYRKTRDDISRCSWECSRLRNFRRVRCQRLWGKPFSKLFKLEELREEFWDLLLGLDDSAASSSVPSYAKTICIGVGCQILLCHPINCTAFLLLCRDSQKAASLNTKVEINFDSDNRICHSLHWNIHTRRSMKAPLKL